MSKRWSKLQSRLYRLMDPAINFQIHCTLYEMNGNAKYHGSKLPRYFITVGKEIVFDYPKYFNTAKSDGEIIYPWDDKICAISNVIEEYVQRPKEELFCPFENDEWGITEILRVCDRRIGKRRLRELMENITNDVLLEIIKARIN